MRLSYLFRRALIRVRRHPVRALMFVSPFLGGAAVSALLGYVLITDVNPPPAHAAGLRILGVIACIPAPLLVFVAIWGLGVTRLTPRSRPGFCRSCGYDLRASTGRCPECGFPFGQSTTPVRKRNVS